MAKRQTVKRKKVTPLRDVQQMALVREKLLDLCEDSQEQVSVPNMVKALQHFVCELAFDTAPNELIATHLLHQIINYHVTEILDGQEKECKNGNN
tara:strand:+ start:16317 stop:16601 length:285 start_codon:yes stop_codon:yes gene_type:complete